MKVPFVDLGWQHKKIKKSIRVGFDDVFSKTSFILGKQVADFEQEFAKFCGVRNCIGVGNGTDALILAMKALGIGRGDEVIMPANTFIASAEATHHLGAKPVLVDIRPRSRAVDVNKLSKAISKKTKAILAVHLYGQPAPMNQLCALAKRRSLFLIEDCAQAHGAIHKNKPVGSWGDIGCFSFYPGKNLGAYGDAGAVVTNNDVIAQIIRTLRDHGSVKKYVHQVPGYNSRLDSLQAVVLSSKLRYVKGWNKLRQRAATLYGKLLASLPFIATPPRHHKSHSVYHLYIIEVPEGSRDALQSHLQANGIATGIHYPIPIHLTPAFAYLKYKNGSFPITEKLSETMLSLPIFPGISRKQIFHVVKNIKDFYGIKK